MLERIFGIGDVDWFALQPIFICLSVRKLAFHGRYHCSGPPDVENCRWWF